MITRKCIGCTSTWRCSAQSTQEWCSDDCRTLTVGKDIASNKRKIKLPSPEEVHYIATGERLKK